MDMLNKIWMNRRWYANGTIYLINDKKKNKDFIAYKEVIQSTKMFVSISELQVAFSCWSITVSDYEVEYLYNKIADVGSSIPNKKFHQFK